MPSFFLIDSICFYATYDPRRNIALFYFLWRIFLVSSFQYDIHFNPGITNRIIQTYTILLVKKYATKNEKLIFF